MGSDDIWDAATEALKGALERKGWDYKVDEGGGAFYGPKVRRTARTGGRKWEMSSKLHPLTPKNALTFEQIDLKIKDAIGRTWQCSTVQCDFNLPDRFDLNYKTKEGDMARPIMVHRAIFGSIERFFGILVENCAGDFPLWLAPTQLRIIPVTDAVMDYCHEVKAAAAKEGIR